MLDPLEYPYVPVTEPGVLDEGGFVPGLGDPSGDPVLAVGSNASPVILQRKLIGVPGPVPMAPCTVGDLTVGHSAHVSRGGYVPAAPYRRRGARSELVVLWPSTGQLAALDATEPSYERRWLDGERYPVWAGVLRPSGCWAYVSRAGLLADAARQPVPLGTQARVHEVLRQLPEIAELIAGLPPAEVVTVLARSQDLVQGMLQRHGRVAAANL